MAASKTPTDTLVEAMDQASESKECMVILTTADGHLLTLCTSEQRVVRMGLLETAKQWMIADMVAESSKEI